MISVAIIDTHNPLMLESLAALLAGNDEINITGQFTSITDFLKASRTVTMNVLIINIYKAHIEEIELIKKISNEIPITDQLVFLFCRIKPRSSLYFASHPS